MIKYPYCSTGDTEITLHGKGDPQLTLPLSEFTLGRGEWAAQTLDDVKQMARDFAEGVS